MKVAQIYEILNNTINQEQIGESTVVEEDLSNIVDVGKTVIDYTSLDKNNFDNFMKSLIDQVGKITFVDRVYTSQAPAILRDSWEYGSILQKVRAELPDAAENKTWSLADMSNGQSIDPFVITKPEVQAKFYNSKTTFEIPITIAEIQLKEAFRSAADMNRFLAMIQNRISMKATLSTDAMAQRTVNNLIAQKVASKNNVVNLLTEYNTATSGSLTAEKALRDPDFLRYASQTMLMYKKFLANASMLYNDAGYITFTPEQNLKITLLSDFARGLEIYLYSDTFHNEFVKLDGYSEVPYWQGSGTDSSLAERSKINVKTVGTEEEKTVEQTYVLGVMFDEQAAAICNDNQRTTSIWNPRGEYWNYFYKYDCMYMNDTAENVVVFTLADGTAT